jgi:hypothetical protein
MTLILMALFLGGCSSPPSAGVVRELLARHFEGRNYRVASVSIGSIKRLPLADKTYMGSRGYLVEVREITLDVMKRSGDYDKGEVLTFRDATVRVKEADGAGHRWVIANISGITVP